MTNSLKNSHKLTIPDLITIGVFTALYFVLVTVATFGSAAIFPGFNNHELKKTNTSALIITHDNELAAGWCDRVIYLEDNK